MPTRQPYQAPAPSSPVLTADQVRQLIREELAKCRPPANARPEPAPAPAARPRPYLVKFRDGYAITVSAPSAAAAKLEAYGRLVAGGHSIEDYSDCVITVLEV